MHARRTCQLGTLFGVLPGLLLAQTPATADDSPPWLHWDAAPECPNKGYIQERVLEWLGGPPNPEAMLSVNAEVHWNDGHWEVTAEISQNEQRGERRVLVASCTEAADFVALSVVLALNPESAGPHPALLIAPPSAAEEEAQLHQPGAGQQPEAPHPAADQIAAPQEQPRVHLSPYVEAQALLNLGLYPEATAGIAGELGVVIESWLFGLGVRAFPSRTFNFEQASHPLKFSQLSGRIRGCYSFLWGDLSLGPCAAFEVGVLRVTEASDSPQTTSDLWLALSPGISGSWQLLPWLAPTSGLELALPLNQSQFVVDDGREVHQNGLGMSAWLGLKANFPKP